MAPKTFSIKEVSEHSSAKSLWMIIDDNVYDVTKFLVEHPGGEEVMLDHGGRDATEGFEDVGHSQDARDMLKEYLIGELVEEEKGLAKTASSSSSSSASNGGDSSTLILVGAVLAAAAVAYKFLM